MGRPPRAVKRIAVSVRFEPHEVELIERVRGPITRQEWIHNAAVAFAHSAERPIAAGRMADAEVEFHMKNITNKVAREAKPPAKREAAQTAAVAASKATGVQVGPIRAVAGSRLKGPKK